MVFDIASNGGLEMLMSMVRAGAIVDDFAASTEITWNA